jgi:SEC-C motif
MMSGGAGLPVEPDVLTKIKRELSRAFGPGTDFARLTRDQEADLAALVIRVCLQTGMSSRIAYGTGAESSSPRKERSIDPREVRRANPNDACPCGSGKKFKSCFGRRPRL